MSKHITCKKVSCFFGDTQYKQLSCTNVFNNVLIFMLVMQVQKRVQKASAALKLASINTHLNMVALFPTTFWLDRNGCWPSRGSQLLLALPIFKHFLLCCSLKDRRRAALSFSKIDHLTLLFFCISCPYF